MLELSPEQLELLGRQMADEGIEFSAVEPIPRRGAGAELELSFAQQQLWLLDQLEPGSPAYNLPTALQLLGELNVPALEAALRRIEERHEALRTTFTSADGRPRQVVNPPAFSRLPVTDLSALAPAERRAEARRLIDEEALRPFDLSRGPLFRAGLLRLDEREHVLLLTMHHIVSDGWSTSILFREVSRLYPALLEGRTPALPELPIQYADYALWQRARLDGEALAGQLRYWKEQLAGAPPLLELPIARPRPAARSNGGASVAVRLGEAEAEALRRLSRAEGVTMFMTLASVFALLLRRYSGQEEVVMGTPVAGRTRSEVEGLVGFFVNTLVLRTGLGGGPTFRELLRRVREVCLGAYAHQDVSFERLVEELRPGRDRSYTPLFQVYINMHSFGQGSMGLPGLEVKSVEIPLLSKFDLTLYVVEDPAGIDLSLVYSTDLFDRPAMAVMVEQLRQLCAQVAREPSKQIDSYSLVTPAAAPALPDPAAPLGSSWQGAVQDLFSERAGRQGDRLAVRDALGSWTYAELAARSNQLANYLLAQKVGREEVVAVYGHRSAALVWAVLGILKAGAAFCILDPAYPDARLTDCLGAARPRAWLQLEEAGGLSPELEGFVAGLPCRCRLRLPAGLVAPEELAGHAEEDPRVRVGPDDLACVTFTSGSTGRPKGVLGRHQSLSHFAAWAAKTFGLGESDRFTMLSGLAHDPLQRDIFTPLQLGAALCVPEQEGILTPGWLACWMARERVTASNLTPAMLQLLSQAAPDSEACAVPSLRHAFVVGDVLTWGDVARLREMSPSVTCVNLYGTTETQRALGFYVAADGTPAAGARAEGESVPAGRGIDEVQLLVLSAAMEPAGVGELGEVYVRSPHLARGYLDDGPLTEARFIVNPLTGAASDRLYKTGDLGCYLPDGVVELFGRGDQQVQIRGFRVEPGEVEAALRRHGGVRECAVVAREHAGGERQLTAYVVPATEVPPAAGDLTRDLRLKLPAYMVPARFVMLDRLPVTPNGKIDRRALPAPADPRPEADAGYVAPRTPVEEMIAGILTELLQVERIGVHDNFFDLGGHSLLAMRLVARVRASLRASVPLADLFETPTVAGLAASIERQLLSPAASEAPPLVHVPREPAPQLSFTQEAWLLRDWWEDVHGFHKRPFHLVNRIRLSGDLDLGLLERALNAVIARHDVLRSTFPKTRGPLAWRGFFPLFRRVLALKGLQGRLHKLNHARPSNRTQPIFAGGRRLVISPAGTLSLRVVDLRAAGEEERAAEMLRVVKHEVTTPFDYNACPMMRAVAFRLGAREHVLNVVIHHLLADGVSNRIFLRDLLEMYHSLAEGRPPALPELPVQYQDFARWQREWLRGDSLASMVSYWKGQLEGVGLFPELTLPFANPSPPVGDFFKDSEAQTSTIGPELCESLRGLCRREGVTLYMMCVGALNALLYRYTRRRKIGFFAPFANRARVETHDLVGWFANNHVLVTECGDDLPFTALLGRVRGVVLGAYAHQEVPFWVVTKTLLTEGGGYEMPERLSEAPYVLFDFDARAEGRPQPSRLSISAVPMPPSTGDAGVEVRVQEHADRLTLSIKYSADRVAPADIGRMLADFHALLQGVVANPDATLRDLPPAAVVER